MHPIYCRYLISSATGVNIQLAGHWIVVDTFGFAQHFWVMNSTAINVLMHINTQLVWKITRSKRPIDAKLRNILTSLKCVQYYNISMSHISLLVIWSIKFALNIFTYLCFENFILNIDLLKCLFNIITHYTYLIFIDCIHYIINRILK